MSPNVTEAALILEFPRRDGLSLETPFMWGVNNVAGERCGSSALLRLLTGSRQNIRGYVHGP